MFYSTNLSTVQTVHVNNDADLNMYLTGFGEDSDGEIYLLGKINLGPSGNSGRILKLTEFKHEDEICFPIVSASGATSVICI